MEEKALKLTTHNESLSKEGQQSKMKISKLKKKNGLLNVDLAWKELIRVEIEQKLEEIVERLKIIEEKNLELHNVIFKKIIRERNYKVPFVHKKFIEWWEKSLLKANVEIRQ
jgi:hypothetical protein